MFMRILREIYLWTRKNCLNCENQLLLDPGIFEGFFNVARYGIFPVWFISAGKLIGFF